MNENKETHPSYGQLSISRVTSNRRIPLYGTSNQGEEYIELTISKSELHRDLHKYWYLDTETLIKVSMSPAQFAEAITSFNGCGTPVTISCIREGEKLVKIPEPPYKHDRDLFEAEFQDDVKTVMADTNSTIEKVKAIMEQKTVSKTALKEVVSVLEKIQCDVNSNMPFIAKSFNEHLDKSVSSAKIEMEAFVDNKLRSAGLEALRSNAPSIAIEKKD